MSRGLIARLLRRPAEHGEPVPDAVLLERYARTRDEAAFELLVWRHAALVLGVCQRAVRDEHRAEDAFQAVFLVLARKASSVRGANLPGWLFRVARRVAARAAAGERRRREEPLAVEPRIEPHDDAERHDQDRIIDEEVARLPDRFRRPVLLCYLGGHTTEDAARVLGCPRGTVLSRLATARAKLADRLTRRGVTLPAVGLTAGVGSVNAVVPPAVRTVSAYLGRAAGPVPSSFLLADGVLRAMKLGKLLTATGGLVVAAGLLGGYALLPGGDTAGPVAVAADEPKKEKEPPKKAEPPKEQPKHPVRDRIDKLETALQIYQRDIEGSLQRIAAVKNAFGIHDEATEAEVAAVRRGRFDLDRELLVTELKELAAERRDLRRDKTIGGEVLAKRQQLLDKQIAEVRTAVAEMESKHLLSIRSAAAEMAGVQGEINRLTASIRVKQQLADETSLLIERLKLALNGVPVPGFMGGEGNVDFNLLNQELRELRREVQELKRK